MKVFISSLIAGFETLRDAARHAVTTLRHEPVMAEDFGAQPNSPQLACLQGLRSSDVVVLVLGERYGTAQPTSGISATHEEYRQARGRKPVIAFVQGGVDPEPEQAAFIAEVQGWEGGLFRGQFRDAVELQAGVTRALHDYELANAVRPANLAGAVERATTLLPRADRNGGYEEPSLVVAVVGEPHQQILRPVQLEANDLAEDLHQRALFGAAKIFDPSQGVRRSIEGASLVIEQERSARIQLDEHGSLLLRLPLHETGGRQQGLGGMPILIEETIESRLTAGIGYASEVLERIDPSQRLTHVVVAARIDGAEYLSWRSQREHEASPNSVPMRMGSSGDVAPVTITQPRAALRLNTAPVVEDLLVPLRRQRKA